MDLPERGLALSNGWRLQLRFRQASIVESTQTGMKQTLLFIRMGKLPGC